MTQLRKKMLEELQRRNYAQSTAKQYVRIVREFAKHYGKTPDQLGPDQIREYSAYLFRERKLEAGTVQQHVAGLRFLLYQDVEAALSAGGSGDAETQSPHSGNPQPGGGDAVDRFSQQSVASHHAHTLFIPLASGAPSCAACR